MSMNIREKNACDIPAYHFDMSQFLIVQNCTFDPGGVPHQIDPVGYHPTTIAQYALANWNRYLATQNEAYRSTFLAQANWLTENEVRIGDDVGGWPISFPHWDVFNGGPWLSALAQGSGISVLTRAYQLTDEERYLEAMHRVTRTFELDILDGGVSTPISPDGIFFEEVAVYPASHSLSGFVWALFGLYDYIECTADSQVRTVIQCSHATMHRLLEEYDTGYWAHADLLRRHLASPQHLALQTSLLEALAIVSSCEHCSEIASRWKGYQRHFGSYLHYSIAQSLAGCGQALLRAFRKVFIPRLPASPPLRVSIPINAFPVTGGTFTVLGGVAEVTSDIWQIKYLTRHIGPDSDNFDIQQFGNARMDPWHFPTVWVYVLQGCLKLLSLVHHGAGYHVILPQDGVFTAAFSGLAAKLAGMRVVCIDHANLTLLKSPIYREEHRRALATRSWSFRLCAGLMLELYWPTLYQIARISGRFVDHFLVPGIVGDGVEEICEKLGVYSSRITRFNSMIDTQHHIIPEATVRSRMREQKGLDGDSIVIAIACRLAPEKGLEVAMESLSQSLARLDPTLYTRVRIIVAGDGPLRQYMEEEIQRRGLNQVCQLWGNLSHDAAIELLSMSDIFLYTSTRGACFPMAVLEAMASGCAVIASKQPMSNAHLLAQERGIAVDAGNAEKTAVALEKLINSAELRYNMGRSARNYIEKQHSPEKFRRDLQRATYWSDLGTLLAGID